MGLADAAGEPDANLELPKRRAQSVTAALAAAGLPAAEFQRGRGGPGRARSPPTARRSRCAAAPT